jgi:hypothetical protein
MYESWKKFQIDHNFRKMTDFITFCVNDVVFPLTRGSNDAIETQLLQLSKIQDQLKNELETLTEQKEQLLSSHAIANPNLETIILNYLRVNKTSNEFHISNDLNLDIQITYETLCYLSTQNKIMQNKKMEWLINVD